MLLLCSSPICLILTVNLPLSDVSEKLPNDERLAGEEVSTALAGEQNGDKRIEWIRTHRQLYSPAISCDHVSINQPQSINEDHVCLLNWT